MIADSTRAPGHCDDGFGCHNLRGALSTCNCECEACENAQALEYCAMCDGDGAIDGPLEPRFRNTCPTCGGTGDRVFRRCAAGDDRRPCGLRVVRGPVLFFENRGGVLLSPK